ncbi:MAG: efflux RND transporter permease subunit [Paracoccus hibiscisoli]|uniref:efflux RND transporter permease subunit n=1 Tax=Paracoccus hibiscisoli TaxID=2023261 RepID=UPI00391CDD7A
MNIARRSVERPLYTWVLILFCLIGGLAGYATVGKLQDPTFTLKSALIITPYPGATAPEVAAEVSETIESEVQKMAEMDTITSTNRPGLSIVEVEMKDIYGGAELPQIWDDLRDRIDDIRGSLPAGAGPVTVNDSFGDVFGIYFAVTAPGYSDSDLWEIASFLRREVLAIPGVADAELRGLPEEAIFVEPWADTLAALGLPASALAGELASVGATLATGAANDARARLRIEPPAQGDSLRAVSELSLGYQGSVISLLDVATAGRGLVDQPGHVIRHDGQEAFTLAVAGLTSENIVTVGARVEARLAQIAPLLPVGVALTPIYQQHRVVDAANRSFLVSLGLSVGVVIAVLAIFMGWRAAVVVGGSLLLTVAATLMLMALFDIKVERISLGALIIAMGMLVDNAIVIAEGMEQRMSQGDTAEDAAEYAAARTQIPLLGATIIGILAFAGIGLSPDSSGEFLFSLFAVVGLSLLTSWLIAVTATPLLGKLFFRRGTLGAAEAYGGWIFQRYRGLVRLSLRFRWLVIIGLVGTTALCVAAFGNVRQQFFPPADTPLFYLNYKAAQGSSIHSTLDDLARVEDWLMARPDVVAVTTSAGDSLSRFILTYAPADPDPSYGQLVIRASDATAIPALGADLAAFTAKALPWAETRVQQIIYGPPVTADVEVRFSGPDPDTLRALAGQALDIFQNRTDLLMTEHVSWREREASVVPVYAAGRAQELGIARADVADAIAVATDGLRVGEIREAGRAIPLILRAEPARRLGDAPLDDQLIHSPLSGAYVPLTQVLDGFQIAVRDTLIARRNRVPTITVQGFAPPGILPPEAFAQVRAPIEAIPLPDGYRMEWGGEFESAGEAQASLGRQMPLAFGAMFLLTLLLFGRLRQTFVIWAVVPMAINGAALGLLGTGLPFSFTALLGLLSLSGMLIKNAIVLVEEIDLLKAETGLPQASAIEAAAVSRLRPIVLAAATTILGMVPLIWDPFFASMAVTIMAGLGFASILTLIGVPAIYHAILHAEQPTP